MEFEIKNLDVDTGEGTESGSGENTQETTEPTLYDTLLEQKLIPEVEEGEDKLSSAFAKIKEDAQAAYVKTLPQDVQLRINAHKYAGGDIQNYSAHAKLKADIEATDLDTLSDEQIIEIYKAYGSKEQDADVQAKTIEALVEQGKLKGRTKEVLETLATSTEAKLESLNTEWKAAFEKAVSEADTNTKSIQELIQEMDTVYNVSLNKEDKEAMAKLLAHRNTKEATKANPKVTNDIMDLLADKENLAKLTFLAKQGYFKKDSKIDLRASKAKAGDATEEDNNNNTSKIKFKF